MQSLLDAQGIAMLALDRQGRIVLANRGAEAWLGQALAEAVPLGWSGLFADGASRDRASAALQTALSGTVPAPIEERVPKAASREARYLTWQLEKAAPSAGAEENVAIIALGFDTTATHREVKALRESELRFREVFENTHDCVFLVDVTPEGFRVVRFNPAEERSVARRTEDVAGKLIEEVVAPEVAETVCANYRRCVEAGTSIHYESELGLPNGLSRFTTTLIPVKDEAGAVYRIVGVSQDVTQARKAEKAIRDLNADLKQRVEELSAANRELESTRNVLARTERLRSLGEMAAGVSHDIKNLLNPVSLHLELIRRSLRKRPDPLIEESVADIAHVLLRGVAMVNRLREFSRQSPEPKREWVDPSELVHEAVQLARSRAISARHSVIVEEEHHAPPRISVQSTEFVSAILNLLVNAIEAMPEGGRIVVRTEPSEGGARIDVKDNGPGIPPDVERRMFEPFFTTKGKEGTGLGLAIAYAFVKRHGGRITVKTGLGQGTTFTLWFPEAVSVEMPQTDGSPPSSLGGCDAPHVRSR